MRKIAVLSMEVFFNLSALHTPDNEAEDGFRRIISLKADVEGLGQEFR